MKSFSFFDDTRAAEARNLQAAKASTAADEVGALDAISTRYRPLFNFWGGSIAVGGWTTPLIRQSWANISPGSPGLSMSFGCIPSHHQTASGQGVATTVAGADAGTHGSFDVQWSELTALYPTEVFAPASARPDFTRDGSVKEIAIGSNTANGPQIRSGLIFERLNDAPTTAAPSTTQTVPTDWIAPAAPIIGQRTSGSNLRSTRGMRDFFRDVYKARRLCFGWSGALTGGASGFITFGGTTARYIFDQTVGTGATAPSPTGPAITVPLRYSAAGRATTVRLYLRVYAAMTGGGTGTFAYFNRSGAGMSAETAMTNPITVSGSTPAWYGCASGTTFSEANDCHFDGNAALSYDRIMLCGKSAGGGTLTVGAFTIHAFHGTR